ncbi:HAD-like domain-containing protein [Camillea tinctor]|nr:HAD-like domain-containing protein [Camillea tinctor]
MSKISTTARRFAPLREGHGQESDLPKLQGIIFDVDGTLCKPQNYMFREMRSALSIPPGGDILEHVYSLPTAPQREAAMSTIRGIERRGMAAQEPQPGLGELMAYLDARGVRKGICTRNFAQPVAHLLGAFLADSVFDPVVTRDFRPPKPDPAGLLFIARSWGLVGAAAEDGGGGGVHVVNGQHHGSDDRGLAGNASHLIMVGDSIDDMTAGRKAGAATVLLANDANRELAEHEHTDLVIERLDELIDVLDKGFVGREVPAAVTECR